MGAGKPTSLISSLPRTKHYLSHYLSFAQRNDETPCMLHIRLFKPCLFVYYYWLNCIILGLLCSLPWPFWNSPSFSRSSVLFFWGEGRGVSPLLFGAFRFFHVSVLYGCMFVWKKNTKQFLFLITCPLLCESGKADTEDFFFLAAIPNAVTTEVKT